jgi:hypothetical protein
MNLYTYQDALLLFLTPVSANLLLGFEAVFFEFSLLNPFHMQV